MAVFVVISKVPNAALESAIAASYPHSHHQFSDLAWLIGSPETARQVSEKIGVKKGGSIRGTIVLAASGAYYGLASSQVWDWLRSAVEGDDD